jgi:outer membrane lipoprotein carrier protein
LIGGACFASGIFAALLILNLMQFLFPVSRRSALLFTIFLVASNHVFAMGDAQKDLENFVLSGKSMRADFIQVSTKPNGQTTRPIRGKLELQRPGQFKFHYQAPFEQIIQSDGQTLTVFDVDLNQASQRKLSQVAAFAPALAVASARDYASIAKSFDVAAIAAPAGSAPNAIRWLRASPKQSSAGEIGPDGAGTGMGADALGGPASRVELAFSGPVGAATLSELVIIDAGGQRTSMKFDKLEMNPRFAANQFKFTLPAGANLIKP